MGILDLFKKKDDVDNSLLGSQLSQTPDMTGIPQTSFEGYMSQPQPGAQMMGQDFSNNTAPSSLSQLGAYTREQGFGSQAQVQAGDSSRELQVISLKLDAIKSEIDAMSQRLRNLEMIAEKEQQQKKWY